MENKYCEQPIKLLPKEVEEINRRNPSVMLPKEYLEETYKAEAIEPRICRDKMFMEIAHIVAKRGTCNRARVGAVLVDPFNNIVSIGYNGAPAGEPHCDQVGHIMYKNHCIRTIHAEENCLNKVDIRAEGTYTMYVTHYPCVKCQIVMLETITRLGRSKLKIIYDNDYGYHSHLSELPDVQKYMEFIKYSS